MTESPENIFLMPKDAALFGQKYGHPDVQQVHVGDESVQYVRKDVADLARPVTVAEAAKVLLADMLALYGSDIWNTELDGQQGDELIRILRAISHK